MPMRASIASTTQTASRARSSRRCAGHMRGASSSIWHGSTRRRSQSRQSNASMRCSRSSATPMASRRRSGRVCNERSRPLVTDLETWLRKQRAKLSAKNEVAKAITYSLNQWRGLTRFLDDGRLCVSNNAAERALRCVAVGRHNWTFAGSDEGGHRAAAIYTLIETAKLNDADPRAWLADVLARLPDHPAKRIGDLLPWNWKVSPTKLAA